MEQLIIHVAQEALNGGHVGPRWMYSSERRNKDVRMVTNKAQVEGSMAEATLIDEIASYCSAYFSEGGKKLHKPREESTTIIERLLVFDNVGRALGRGKARTLDEKEYKAAHNYVLFNSPETKTVLAEFDRYMTNISRANRAGGLEKARQDDFAN